MKIEKSIKNMFRKDNLGYLVSSIVIAIIILNLYSKILAAPINGWLSIPIILVCSIFGLFIADRLLRLRNRNMVVLEFFLTLILMLIILILLQKYYPALLYGANAFLEPSREVLTEMIQ